MIKNNIAFIPARIGSQRLKFKNLALLNTKPLIYYAINAAKKSNMFSKIVLNSDDIIFQKIADRYKVDFYLRPKELGKNNVKSDDVLYDFINKFQEYKNVCWVNPIAPLQTSTDIKKIINYFNKNKLDSLITVDEKYVHSTYKKKPVNYQTNKKFEQTQNLIPVYNFIYTLMMWKSKKFIDSYKLNKYGFFCGKFDTFPLDNYKSIIIKNKKDLFLAEKIIKYSDIKNKKILYDKILNKKL
tara:strand:+ start:97 stop:819 length:723 start_codon:yes stop_codon:yes gene_type:complete